MLSSRTLALSSAKPGLPVPSCGFMYHSDHSAHFHAPIAPVSFISRTSHNTLAISESMVYGRLITLCLFSAQQTGRGGIYYGKTQYPVKRHLLQPTFQTLPEPPSTEGRCHRVVKTPHEPASETPDQMWRDQKRLAPCPPYAD
ncbi:hypothetical protein E1301_Tti015092 [Triplophysa tibetana]|uniref:Uncharacterized protein n=1 Tax=Triplophysa tibetana TaxID=1572043 RepID=A0A5A9NQL0_9TELE|nr:hypothetical protein E1301_Tti015092 [Triplophysa tibetana]